MHKLATSLNRALAGIGRTGIVGLGLLIFSAGFYASWIAPRHEQIRALEVKSARLQQPSGPAPVGQRDRGPLSDFYGFFPSPESIPKSLDLLFGLAQRNGLEITKSDYRLVASADPNITTYQVRFPLKGTYVQVRKFVAAALQELPFASLDELRLEKKRVEDANVDSQIRFTFFLRAK
jgi:hypothetical protein